MKPSKEINKINNGNGNCKLSLAPFQELWFAGDLILVLIDRQENLQNNNIDLAAS